MMTSKAMSKVTNITAVNTKAVEQRLPQRDLADHAHETGDQQEARDIEPEELHGEAEQQCRHEHRHHAAKLRPRDEDLAGFLARQERGDQSIEAGAGEDDREIEREIAGCGPVDLQPAPVRQLS